ncbi:MAG: PAS domain-containing protein [Spirochaetota bacterium]
MMLDDNIQSFLQSINDRVYILDFDRKIIFWNKAAESITGFTASEVIGKSCSDNILRHIDMDGNSLCISSCPMLIAINNRHVV